MDPWLIKQTQQEQEHEQEKIICFFEWKTPGAQMKVFFLFSFAIFVGCICIFQKSTKENSPGAEMDDLHIEDSTEGEV